MNKNIIYLIKYDSEEDHDAVFEYTFPFIESYADRHKADLKVIRPKLRGNGKWFGYHTLIHPYFSKLEAVIDFNNSSYEKMLYLDYDIFINNDEHNIFELVNDGFAAAEVHEPKLNKLYNRWYLSNFNSRNQIPIINGGLLLFAGKENTLLLHDMLESELKRFTSEHSYHLRRIGCQPIGIHDQPVFTYFIEKSKMNFTLLPSKWNKRYYNASKSDYFVHYTHDAKNIIGTEVDKFLKKCI